MTEELSEYRTDMECVDCQHVDSNICRMCEDMHLFCRPRTVLAECTEKPDEHQTDRENLVKFLAERKTSRPELQKAVETILKYEQGQCKRCEYEDVSGDDEPCCHCTPGSSQFEPKMQEKPPSIKVAGFESDPYVIDGEIFSKDTIKKNNHDVDELEKARKFTNQQNPDLLSVNPVWFQNQSELYTQGYGPDDEDEPGHNNGGSTDYYKFNPGWTDCQDIIEDRQMNFSQGNIFKVAFCFNMGRHPDATYERELNKIIWFANREIERIAE